MSRPGMTSEISGAKREEKPLQPANVNEMRTATTAHDEPSPSSLKHASTAVRNQALTCEARNALQVVLSGAEILLEDHLKNLMPGQKELLSIMIDNAYRLCNLFPIILGAEQQPGEGKFYGVRRSPAKV